MREETTWSEFEIIARFFSPLQGDLPDEVVTGIGDDAAVLRPAGEVSLLVTHDLMVEDIHYKSSWMPPHALARKLVKVNVSDIAAMGGIPRHGLLSIALPDPLEKGWLETFASGLSEAFREYDIRLIGGDTSRSPGPVMVALTLLGHGAENSRPVLRHHPRSGDTLYVTGTIGDAALGLLLLNQSPKKTLPTEDENFLIQRHLNPTPRVTIGQEIAKRGIASAMIDISDGLVADLEHLLEGTSLGAGIHLDALPLSVPFTRLASRFHDSPEGLALSGGEDYELLFTSPIPPEEISFSSALPPVTPIGRITPSDGIVFLREGKQVPLEVTGFQHKFHQKG